jgi:hypothetical protein
MLHGRVCDGGKKLIANTFAVSLRAVINNTGVPLGPIQAGIASRVTFAAQRQAHFDLDTHFDPRAMSLHPLD